MEFCIIPGGLGVIYFRGGLESGGAAGCWLVAILKTAHP